MGHSSLTPAFKNRDALFRNKNREWLIQMDRQYKHESGFSPPFCSVILNFVGLVLRLVPLRARKVAATSPGITSEHPRPQWEEKMVSRRPV